MIDESAFQAVRYLCVTIWISPQKRPLSEVSVGAPAVKVPRLCSERTGGEEKDPGRRDRSLLGGKGKRRVSFGTFRTAMSPGRKSGYVGIA